MLEQNRYALAEARYLEETPVSKLNRPDRIRRRVILAPALVFFFTAFYKRLLFDGWPGWYYILQRVLAEIILSLRLLEIKLNHKR
jgi:hypothetical protein